MVPSMWCPQEVLTQCLLINSINREIAFLSYNDICCHCWWHAQNAVEICSWNTKATFDRCCGTELLSDTGTSDGWFNPLLIAVGETFLEQAPSMNGEMYTNHCWESKVVGKTLCHLVPKVTPLLSVTWNSTNRFFLLFNFPVKIDSPGEILEKSSGLGPTPRTSVFISLDMAQVLVFLKSPRVILMCSQCW